MQNQETKQKIILPNALQHRVNLLECKIETFCEIQKGSHWHFKNAWVKQQGLGSLYLRRTCRLIYELVDPNIHWEKLQSKMSLSLDIAGIQIDAMHQRKVIGSRLINYCHEVNPQQVTYIECVHNPILAGWLERNGWTKQEDVGNCYYKIKTNTL